MKKLLFSAFLVITTGLLFSCASEDKSGESPSNPVGAIEPVTIGTQVWMKRNLDVDVPGSKCYNNDPENCIKYGRLYNWTTAMNLPSNCASNSCAVQIQAKHQGICPTGWHIPSNEDWDKLYRFADGSTGTESPYESPTAGKHLKSVTGWNPYEGIENLDTYGFSALPGGGGISNGDFEDVGKYGVWWSASENEDYGDSAYFRGMDYSNEYAYWETPDKSHLFSVRCLQD